MFTLMQLPYSYDSLQPAIDKETVRRHYYDNHRAYVTKLNKLLSKRTDYAGLSLEQVIHKSIGIDTEIHNCASQIWNHDFYWNSLGPCGYSGSPGKRLYEFFTDLSTFKAWTNAGTSRFGSGWLWLLTTSSGQLQMETTANAGIPAGVPSRVRIPLLVIDLWEHAYCCQYGSNREEYIRKTMSIINWDRVHKRAAT